VFSWLYTFVIVVFGWVIFRMETVPGILNIFKAMFGANGFTRITPFFQLNVLQYLPWFFIAFLFAAPVYERVQKLRTSFLSNFIYDLVLFILLVLCICFMLTNSFNPFIYFRF
jgi:alginate O-acetyltransferase complex protein AlgI